MYKKIIYSTVTILWVIVIFGFSLQPADVSSNLSGSFLRDVLVHLFPVIADNEKTMHIAHVLVRKCAHFSEYLILGILSYEAIKQFDFLHKPAINIAFCIFIACMDETLQLFVNGREGRILDVCIDGFGALMGIVLIVLIMKLTSKYEKNIKKI